MVANILLIGNARHCQARHSRYGCLSCGPRGFNSTIDTHLEVERVMSGFLGMDGVMLYTDGMCTNDREVVDVNE
jgi:7-keto-8-aminopelargonate synthetase-like enzyme